MYKTYQILNGDSLYGHFPKQIEGDVIIMRECLVEGDVQCRDLEDFFNVRENIISNTYGGGYNRKCRSEFEKMQNIPKDSEINLWFEDDLFCQVNLWFVINLLNNSSRDYIVNLVRPTFGHEYGFAMTEEELISAYTNKIQISSPNIERFSKLWKHYQSGDSKKMIHVAKELNDAFPFIKPACEAHIDRLPVGGSPGRPERSIIRIMEELNTTDFIQVFREFTKREGIYGYGDFQVKRLYDNIIKNT